jgi:hypothetical protein
VNPAPYSVPPVSVRRTMHLHLLARSVASEKAAAIRPASIYFVATLHAPLLSPNPMDRSDLCC